MKWPAQNPDLSLIENTWAYLEMKIRNRNGRAMNADKLFDILQEEYAIPDDYFTNLIRSMRNRVNIVVQNKGRSTKY